MPEQTRFRAPENAGLRGWRDVAAGIALLGQRCPASGMIMLKQNKHRALCLRTCAIVSVIKFALTQLHAQPLSITGLALDANGHPSVQFNSDTNSYYTLLRGNSISNIVTAVDMRFGQSGQTQLADSIGAFNIVTWFYVIREVPLNQPLDNDGDDIDDIYELLHPSILSAVNPADAHFDPDGNGLSNLVEYRKLFGYDASVVEAFSHEASVFNFGAPSAAH